MENDKNIIKPSSEIKLEILEKYLISWARILSKANQKLRYIDCYAGGGTYLSASDGIEIDGSPLVALEQFSKFRRENQNEILEILLIEKDHKQFELLDGEINLRLSNIASNFDVKLEKDDCKKILKNILNQKDHPPTFYNIDPYGYPPSISTINSILEKEKSEILLTLMLYRFNIDLTNPQAKSSLDAFFGNGDWENQGFQKLRRKDREDALFEYIKNKLKAKFKCEFRIVLAEDEGKGYRTKYYLIHLANHDLANKIVKEIMWDLGEPGTFESSDANQGKLFSATPTDNELENELYERYMYKKQSISFKDVVSKTYELPFKDEHYRRVLKDMEKNGKVEIERIDSQKTGLKENDLITFLGERDE